MTKFQNRDEPGYDAITGELQRWKGLVRAILEKSIQNQELTGSKGNSIFGIYILCLDTNHQPGPTNESNQNS